MKKAILFDFDGVIILSETARFAALRGICERYGIALHNADKHALYGKPTMTFLNNLHLQPTVIGSIVTAYEAEYKSRIVEHVSVVASTQDFLLSRAGAITACLVSMSDRAVIDKVLAHLNMDTIFSYIISKQDVQKHKPNPECYLMAAAHYGLSTGNCMVVEDSPVGVAAAQSAGMECYVLLNGENKIEDFSDYEVRGFVTSANEIAQAWTRFNA